MDLDEIFAKIDELWALAQEHQLKNIVEGPTLTLIGMRIMMRAIQDNQLNDAAHILTTIEKLYNDPQVKDLIEMRQMLNHVSKNHPDAENFLKAVGEKLKKKGYGFAVRSEDPADNAEKN